MKSITVETTVSASMAKVWNYWNKPKHIVKWAFASSDWEAPSAENDLYIGGKFKTRMEAKDKSSGFDFNGTYTVVKKHELIEYNMEKAPGETAARHVKIEFKEIPEGIRVAETFDLENQHSQEMQRSGWQAILNNFKKYAEANQH